MDLMNGLYDGQMLGGGGERYTTGVQLSEGQPAELNPVNYQDPILTLRS